MTYEEITAVIASMGIPYAYHHFAEGQSPEPPFLVYLYPGSDNFSADGVVYQKIDVLNIELYTDIKDVAQEKIVEDALDSNGFFYQKSEVWIESEKLYEVLYEMEVSICQTR